MGVIDAVAALLDSTVTRSEPTTTGVVDAVAALLGPMLVASCCEPPLVDP